jgi:hypothetical protein
MTMHWFDQFFLSKSVSVDINAYIDVHTLSFITDKLRKLVQTYQYRNVIQSRYLFYYWHIAITAT